MLEQAEEKKKRPRAKRRDLSTSIDWNAPFYRMYDLQKHGPLSKSKMYADAKAGKLKIKRLGGVAGVFNEDFREYLKREAA